MNRVEFLAELERLLSGMPEEERQAALQYYADYLADAGEDNQAEAIRELGSPEKVAESIRADYYGTEFDESKFDHKNYMEKYGQRSGDNRQRMNAGTGTASGAGNGSGGAGAPGQDAGKKDAPWTSRGVKIFLIILIAIVVWPVALGIACVLLGCAAVVICFFAGLVIAAAAIMLAGGIVAVTGLALMVIPPAGMIVIGVGILLFALGLMATVGTVKLCIIVYPAMFRGFVDLCRRPFYGKAVS